MKIDKERSGCAAVNSRATKTPHWKRKITNATNEHKGTNNTNKRTKKNSTKNYVKKSCNTEGNLQENDALLAVARFAEVSSIFALHK